MKGQAKAVILARVSSKTQEDEGYSLDSQLKLLQGYCDGHGLEVVRNFKIAETASKEQGRKIFHELLIFISKRKIHHLIVEKTDRFTRNFRDAITLDDWLEGNEDRRLHAVKESLLLHKNASSDVKFMWNIHLSVAKKYTDNLREEAMKGWAEKLAQGWLPAEPPPGYATVVQDGKRIHIVNVEIYQHMPRIFRLALLPGYTRKKLSEEMALVGITTRTGRPFSASRVTKILTNPFYIGINRMQGKEYPGAQEPIITKKLFYEVQHRLKSGRSESRQRVHNPIFKRMIICGSCGTYVSWSDGKGRYYGTCLKRKEGCWGRKYLREDRVEATVIRELEEIDDRKGRVLVKVRTALQLIQPQDIGIHRQKMIAEISTKVRRMKRMEENLYDDRLAGFISKEKYAQKREQIEKQTVELAERLTMLREAQSTSNLPKQESLSDDPIVDLYLKSTPTQKRIMLSALFKEIYVKDGVLSFTFRK